jgi:hypothetical protein
MVALIAGPGQCVQVIVITLIGSVDEAFVKAPLVCSALVTTDQQDRLAQGIEGIVKQNGPDHGQIMDLKPYDVKSIPGAPAKP